MLRYVSKLNRLVTGSWNTQSILKYTTIDSTKAPQPPPTDKVIINDDKDGIKKLVKESGSSTSHHTGDSSSSHQHNDKSKIEAFDRFADAQSSKAPSAMHEVKEKLKESANKLRETVKEKAQKIKSSIEPTEKEHKVATGGGGGEEAIDAVAEGLVEPPKKDKEKDKK